MQSRLHRLAKDHRASMWGKFLRIPLKLVPRSAVVPILTGPLKGTRWVAGSFLARCWLGTYEIEKQREVLQYLHAGQIAYDIGAHSGFFTLLFSSLVGPEGRVLAFEPVPQNVEKIFRHLHLNGVENVSVFPVALSSVTGFSGFQAGLFDSGGRLTHETKPLVVPLSTIDAIVASGMPSPDFVKVDVEGSELEVLQGSESVLAGKRAVWSIALHGDDMLAACPQFLEDHGYRVSWLSREGFDALGRSLGEITALPDRG